jgi:hypothetical protein
MRSAANECTNDRTVWLETESRMNMPPNIPFLRATWQPRTQHSEQRAHFWAFSHSSL